MLNRFSKMMNSFKVVGLVLLVGVMGTVARAETMTLELVDGTVYTEVHVKRSQPTTLSFRHAEGFATVPAGALTDESLSKLGLDPVNNPEFKTQREDMAMKENLRTLKKNRATIPGGVGTGQTIKTKDITDINPITLLITEEGVPRRVEIVSLPKEIQQELGYDATKAAEYSKMKSQAEAVASQGAAQVKAEQDKLEEAARLKRAEEEKKAAEAAAAAAPTVPANDPNKFNAIKPVK